MERDLERGGIGPGRWYVAVRIESSDIAAMTKARKMFTSGWMNASEVDALCRKAAVAPELAMASVAVAAAADQKAAERLLENTPVARLRFELKPILEPRSGFGVVLEGPWRHIRDSYRRRQDVTGPAGARIPAERTRMAANGGRVQLSLFGDTASVDA